MQPCGACLHITLKRSKVPLTKTVMLTERVNETVNFPFPLENISVCYLVLVIIQIDVAVRDHTVYCERSIQKGLHQ